MALSKTAGAEEKYYIYSSNAGKTPDQNVQVLPKGTNTDLFVSSLKDHKIILQKKPDLDASFDRLDEWWKWLCQIDQHAQISLSMDKDKKNIEKFEFDFKDRWGMTFSSSADAVRLALGDQAANIPVPGIDQDGVLLYCGLVPPPSDLTATVEDLFTYVGLSKMLDILPSAVRTLTGTLQPSKCKGARNALWFEPPFSYRIVIRLGFDLLETKKDLEAFLRSALPGFDVKEAHVICKKIFTEGKTSKGLIGIDQGKVMCHVSCAVTPKTTKTPVEMTAGIQFQESGISLSFQLNTADGLAGILTWLGELVSNDPDYLQFVHSLLQKDKAFDGLYLRQMLIGLDTTQDPDKKPKLTNFRIDIEVAGNFGHDHDGKKPVFLVSYSWTRFGSKLGSIHGQFWNWYDDPIDRVLKPHYEKWADLQPITPDPAKSIQLATIIPNQQVDDIPRNVPSEITRAYVDLSPTAFRVGATITTTSTTTRDASPGLVPQPYLGQVRLDASYAWGKKSEFKFDLGIMAGLKPSSSSKHQEPALLTGELSYIRSG